MTTLLTQPSGNETADDDHLFVCCACGKTSTTRYGFDDTGVSTASPGWDESCMMNAQLVLKAHCKFSPGGRVIDVVDPEATNLAACPHCGGEMAPTPPGGIPGWFCTKCRWLTLKKPEAL